MENKYIPIKNKESIDKIIELTVNKELNKLREKRNEFIFNMFKYFIAVIFITLLFLTLYMFYIDNPDDEKACEIYLQGALSDRDLKIDKCYANNDIFKLNFQKDLSCSCFYYDKYDYLNNYLGSFDWLKGKDFNIN